MAEARIHFVPNRLSLARLELWEKLLYLIGDSTMRSLRIAQCAALLIGAVLALPSYAAPERGDWPEYKADAIGYFENKLPSPVVIYMYTSSGKLISIINSNGHNDKVSIQKIGSNILNKNFPGITEPHRNAIAKSMKQFLLDQGYALDKIINNKTKFTLLLTLFAISDHDCATYRQIYREYEHVIRKSIQPHQGQDPEYSVVILRLQSPLVHLECKK